LEINWIRQHPICLLQDEIPLDLVDQSATQFFSAAVQGQLGFAPARRTIRCPLPDLLDSNVQPRSASHRLNSALFTAR
jgi:hypothetical protein